MNRKFKRTAFIWYINLPYYYKKSLLSLLINLMCPWNNNNTIINFLKKKKKALKNIHIRASHPTSPNVSDVSPYIGPLVDNLTNKTERCNCVMNMKTNDHYFQQNTTQHLHWWRFSPTLEISKTTTTVIWHALNTIPNNNSLYIVF